MNEDLVNALALALYWKVQATSHTRAVVLDEVLESLLDDAGFEFYTEAEKKQILAAYAEHTSTGEWMIV